MQCLIGLNRDAPLIVLHEDYESVLPSIPIRQSKSLCRSGSRHNDSGCCQTYKPLEHNLVSPFGISTFTTPIGYESLVLGPDLWLGLSAVVQEKLLKLFLAASQGCLSGLTLMVAMMIDPWRYLTRAVAVLVKIDQVTPFDLFLVFRVGIGGFKVNAMLFLPV